MVNRIKETQGIQEDNWISTNAAMRKLGISGRSTLQKWRLEGRIRFTQPEKRIILDDKDSIQVF
ncbi:DNA-binding protein [Algoriphagus sp.]|uniref:DNA-binding protein n=1 Tax=Algoriphagus sp. TaxID=1872435 RepID=UPI00261BCC62|nr:DNA-binding protein [Algoriphagus sp.]